MQTQPAQASHSPAGQQLWGVPLGWWPCCFSALDGSPGASARGRQRVGPARAPGGPWALLGAWTFPSQEAQPLANGEIVTIGWSLRGRCGASPCQGQPGSLSLMSPPRPPPPTAPGLSLPRAFPPGLTGPPSSGPLPESSPRVQCYPIGLPKGRSLSIPHPKAQLRAVAVVTGGGREKPGRMDRERAPHLLGGQVPRSPGPRGGALFGKGTWEAEAQWCPHPRPGAAGVQWGRGPPASPGGEDDDPGLQLPCLHQQGRHVLGPRVKLQHLLCLWCEQER